MALETNNNHQDDPSSHVGGEGSVLGDANTAFGGIGDTPIYIYANAIIAMPESGEPGHVGIDVRIRPAVESVLSTGRKPTIRQTAFAMGSAHPATPAQLGQKIRSWNLTRDALKATCGIEPGKTWREGKIAIPMVLPQQKYVRLGEYLETFIPEYALGDSDKSVQEKIREALEIASPILTAVAKEIYVQWGLSPESLPIAASDMVVRSSEDISEKERLSLGITPGYFNYRKKEYGIVANYFGYAIKEMRAELPRVLPPTLFLLSAIYAEEVAVHGRCALKRDFSETLKSAFTEAYRRVCTDQDAYVNFRMNPYPTFLPSSEDVEATELDQIIGLEPWYRWGGKDVWLHDANIVNEVVVKSLTFQYMSKLAKILGYDASENLLWADYNQFIMRDFSGSKNFFDMKVRFNHLTPHMNTIVPMYMSGELLETVMARLSKKSFSDAEDFAYAILKGDVFSVAHEIAPL